MSVADLKAELARQLVLTVEKLQRCAAIVAELDRRGENLADLKISILPLLRKIARGELLAEIVVGFANRPRVIRELSNAPMEEQRQAAASGEYRSRQQRARTAQRRNREEVDSTWMGQLRRAVEGASPGDVAELCIEMVMHADDPAAVRIRLEAMLKEIEPKRRKVA